MDRIHLLLDNKPDDAPAVFDTDGAAFSYSDLRSLSADLAEVLAREGLRPGDRLLLVTENCALYAAAIFAASRISAWLTLCNARATPTELDAMLAHSGARLVLFTGHVSEHAAAHATRIGARGCGTLSVGSVLVAGPFEAATETVTDTADQIAALLYTTGTTSEPKGVMLSHGNLVFNARNNRSLSLVEEGDRCLAVLPGTHVFGFASVFLPMMNGGAAIRFVPKFDPAFTLDRLEEGYTHFSGVPQMYAAMIAELDRRGRSLDAPGLKHLTSGGAPLDPDLKARVEDLFGHRLDNGYGQTETSPTVAITRGEEGRGATCVGQPVEHVEVRIAEPNAQGIGELLVRGPNVMQGYYRAPEKTAEALMPEGWLRTGDLARRDPDGALHIVGRLKELIIRSGFNVYPPEVEAMLTKHPDVYQAAVVGRPLGGDEEIVAFLITNGQATDTDIRAWLRDKLAGYKVPNHILIVESFPSAATGKILKHKLLTHFADRLKALEVTAR